VPLVTVIACAITSCLWPGDSERVYSSTVCSTVFVCVDSLTLLEMVA